MPDAKPRGRDALHEPCIDKPTPLRHTPGVIPPPPSGDEPWGPVCPENVEKTGDSRAESHAETPPRDGPACDAAGSYQVAWSRAQSEFLCPSPSLSGRGHRFNPPAPTTKGLVRAFPLSGPGQIEGCRFLEVAKQADFSLDRRSILGPSRPRPTSQDLDCGRSTAIAGCRGDNDSVGGRCGTTTREEAVRP